MFTADLFGDPVISKEDLPRPVKPRVARRPRKRLQAILDQLDLPLGLPLLEQMLKPATADARIPEQAPAPAEFVPSFKPRVLQPSVSRQDAENFISCVSKADKFDSDYTHVWSLDDVADTYSLVLEEAFWQLSQRGNSEEKLHVLEWIYAPHVVERIGRGEIIRRYAEEIPFSFERCCKFECLNADKLRVALLEILPEAIRAAIVKCDPSLLHTDIPAYTPAHTRRAA